MSNSARKVTQKVLSIFLSIGMLTTALPLDAFAEGVTASPETVYDEVQDTEGSSNAGAGENSGAASTDNSNDAAGEADVADATINETYGEATTDLYSEDENPFAEYMQEGDWWYDFNENFVTIRGYSGDNSEIAVPSMIGGKVVTSIQGSILLENNNVEKVYIPGCVSTISPVAFMNAGTITLRGYNGTAVHKYASQMSIRFENMSTVSLEEFDADTVDYSYADTNAVNVISDNEIEIAAADAALLTVGSKIYLPVDGGKIYKVAALFDNGNTTGLSVDLVYPASEETDGNIDGNWVYEIVDGYAVVTGYNDYSTASLVIPDKLGGYYVNGIGEKAFAKNVSLTSIRVHGNVINIADDAFAGLNVELSGYNGTQILRFARSQGYSYKNLTNVEGFVFREKVVDFSYADNDRYEITGEETVEMHTAEAAQLSVGSIFYIPETYGELIAAYKVVEKTVDGDWTIITVTEATAEDSLISISVQESALTPDWTRAEWSDEVELIEEKLGGEFNFGASVGLGFKHNLTKKISLEAEGKLGLTGKAAVDFNVWQWKLKELELIAEPYVQFTGELKGATSLADKKDDSLHSKFESTLKDGSAFEVYLGKVPLVSVAKVVEVQAAVYVKFDLEGKITFSIKGSGELGVRYNKVTESIDGVNKWSWSKPTIEVSGSLELGPAEAVQLEVALLGKVVSVDLFQGITAEVKWTNQKPECIDANVGYKIECTVTFSIDFLKKFSASSKFTIFCLQGKLGLFHIEFGKGIVPSCTYGNVYNVHFNTSYGTVDSQKLEGGSKVTQPTLDVPGHTLNGWYTDKNCTTPWNFDTDTVKSDITLYAKWDSITHKVTYKMNYEKADYETTSEVGVKLIKPADPMWMDHVFEGWYKDAAFTTAWNFTTDLMPDNDITLYAKWREEEGYDPYVVGNTSSGDVTFMGHSYTHIMTYMSYSEATAYARDRGGYLATINSKEEQDFLASYLYSDCAQTYLWLGMNSTGGWTHWATGEKITYTNWESSPQMSSSQYNGALRRSTGKWTTLSNSDTAHFVIEWGNYSVDPGYNPNTEVDDVQYTVDTATGTASVTGWNTDAEGIVISSVYNGYPVTSIIAKAFQNNTKIKTISIPSSVTTIGDYAFAGCTSLTSISLPDSVTSLGQYAFQNCTNLGSAKLSSQLTAIPRYAFHGDKNLVAVTGIGNVKAINEYAFYNCTALNTITFPGGLETIGQHAFYCNYALPNIIIPSSVTSIGSRAFYWCSGAATITIPDKISSLPSYAFYNCSNVTSIYIPATVTSIGSNALYRVNGTYKVYRNSYAANWAEANNKTIEYLGATYRVVFSTNNSSSVNIAEVQAGNLVEDVYVEAGKRITEPSVSIEGYEIEGWYTDSGFSKKWNFASNVMPEYDITLYAKWAETNDAYDFDVVNNTVEITGYNGSSDNVVIPSTIKGYPVTAIAENAFTSDSIVTLTIPSSVKTIKGGAFNCENLTTIVVSGNYFKVEDGVLYTKSGKTLVYAPQGRTYATYTVADGTTMIVARAFKDQECLKKIFIPDSVTSIASSAFEGNHTLTIYGSIGTCAAKTFANRYGFDYNLYVVHFYDGSREAYKSLVEAGTLISDYYQPTGNFLSFGGWFKDSALTTEWDFETDTVPASDMNLYLKWNSDFAVTASGSGVTITGYNGTLSDIVIPETINGYTVVGIAAGAFTDASIRSVTIPDCVTDIAAGAFHANVKIIANDATAAKVYADENGLAFELKKYKVIFDEMGGSIVSDIEVAPGETFALPATVRSNYYFAGWYSDTSFSQQWTSTSTMPQNDLTLYAHWRIANINITEDFTYNILNDGTVEIVAYTGAKTSLSIPDTIDGYTVSRIGDFAFSSNTTLLSVNIPSTVTSIGEYAFADTKVRLISGGDGLNVIEDGAFIRNSGLRNLVIPAGVTSIGDSAFMSCGSLTDVVLPEGLVEIGKKAFYNCVFLDEVVFPTTLAVLSENSFKSNPRLLSVTIPVSLMNSAEAAFDNATAISYMGAKTVSILSLERKSLTTIGLTWNDVEDADKYAVSRKTDADAAFKRIKTVTTTEASVLGGAAGLTSSFKIIALDASGKVICESEPVSIIMSAIETPSIASVTQKTSSTATMVLNTVNDVDGYEIHRAYTKSGEYALLKSVTQASFVNSGLIPGVDYYYKVRAYVENEDLSRTYSNWSEVYYFHMPYKFMVAPTGVTARQTTASASEVTWNAVDGAEGYIVYRSLNGGSFLKLKEVTSTKAQNVSLKSGNNYRYKVSAYFYDQGIQIVGPQSDEYGITIQTVATPEITELSQSSALAVSLKWSGVAGATGYNIYRSTSENGIYKKLKSVTTTEAIDTSGLTIGTAYFYRVEAYATDSDSNVSYSELSPVKSLTISRVITVVGVSAEQAGSAAISLSWTAVSSADGYEVWSSVNNENNYSLVSDTTDNTITIDNLTGAITHYFKIRAYTLEGSERVYGEFSESVDCVILGSPVLSVVEQSGKGSVDLVWSRVDGSDGYDIWRKTGEGAYKFIKSSVANNTTCFSLTANTVYTFKVRAYKLDDDGNKQYGFYSNEGAVRILGTTSITSIETVGVGSVTLTWNSVEGAEGYDLYRCDTIDGVFKKVKTTTDTTVTHFGLAVGNTYYFKIVPYAMDGTTKKSGMPTAVKGIRILEKPVITTAEQTGTGSVTITWDPVPNATSYKVLRSDASAGTYVCVKTVTDTQATVVGLTAGKQWYFKVIAVAQEDGVSSESQASVYKRIYLTTLTKPVISSIEQTSATALKLAWNKVTNAKGYEVVVASSEEGPYTSLKTIEGQILNTTHTDLTDGQTLFYKVRPYVVLSSGEKAYGMYSNVVGARVFVVPKITALYQLGMTSSVLEWESVTGATSYNVYRSSTSSGPYSLIKNTTDTTITNYSLTTGGTYYYKVAPVISDGSVNSVGMKSSALNLTISNLKAPSLTSVKQTTSNTVVLAWNAVNGAEGYEISMAEAGSGQFKGIKNVTTTTTTTSYGIEDGKSYEYRVRAYVLIDGKKAFSGYSTAKTVQLLTTPVFPYLYQQSSGSAVLVWNEVQGATGYEVYRKVDDGSFAKLKDVSETTVTNVGLTAGRTYTYKIRAYSTDGTIKNCSGYSAELSITPVTFTDETYPESEHNYANGMDTTWTYSIAGAEKLLIKFSSSTYFENNYDKLYITDSEGNAVGQNYYTGSQLANAYIVVEGDTVNFRMTTDGSVTKYGFSIELIKPAGK